MTTIWGGSAQIYGNKDVSYRQDNLIAGELQPVTQSITLKGNQGILRRGTIIGKDNTGVYVVSKATATDGSEKALAVLVDTYDTSSGDVSGAGGYFTGEFNASRIIIDDSWTLETLRDAGRPLALFFQDVVNADNPT
ncbi:head decoration protein [Commensalibacter oyaizuii]|uniref:Head decoration protein n=1 Tax=Commensalibacter oyaizuii TaxID=3043873 RepID=A0ABT6Q4Z0_9PROT|nr:head decoration protein [Commensalibacter sp. TBRC 16381]MDI2091616.1 head decoration protein [Commensalibacter sp. TBRC 16381]